MASKRRSPLYTTWNSMKHRCFNPRNSNFKHYGAKGISVCERWMSLANFVADVGERPSPKHTLDRINNAGNYEPGNVRWATQREQLRNQTRNRLLTFRGVTRCLSEWCELLGFDKWLISARLKAGWSVEKAFTTPKRPINRSR